MHVRRALHQHFSRNLHVSLVKKIEWRVILVRLHGCHKGGNPLYSLNIRCYCSRCKCVTKKFTLYVADSNWHNTGVYIMSGISRFLLLSVLKGSIWAALVIPLPTISQNAAIYPKANLCLRRTNSLKVEALVFKLTHTLTWAYARNNECGCFKLRTQICIQSDDIKSDASSGTVLLLWALEYYSTLKPLLCCKYCLWGVWLPRTDIMETHYY